MSSNRSESCRPAPAGFRISSQMLAVLSYLQASGPCDRARIVSAHMTAPRFKQAVYKTVYDLERKRLIEPLAPNVTGAYRITELGKTILAMATQE